MVLNQNIYNYETLMIHFEKIKVRFKTAITYYMKLDGHELSKSFN